MPRFCRSCVYFGDRCAGDCNQHPVCRIRTGRPISPNSKACSRYTRNQSLRPGVDEYFMMLAEVAATRATCPRKHVGAVIVRDRTVLSTGYNGSIRGLPHCSDVGCIVEGDHCVAAVHAECNAIAQAAKNGVGIDRASIYITASPCWPCFKLVVNAGIQRIVFGEFYKDERIFQVAKQLGIELVDVSHGHMA